MSEYTAEDFETARFAEHPDGRIATRDGGVNRDMWIDSDGEELDDIGACVYGWRPVVEADHPTRPLAGYRAQVKELRADNEALRDKVEGLMRQLSAGERTVAALRALAPLTLDTLREAWENAEAPTEEAPIREGDTLISWLGDELWTVRVAKLSDLDSDLAHRVLHRAPQPEPWQALADEMEELYDGYSLRAAEAAQFLHERGVRVTGGGDDE